MRFALLELERRVDQQHVGLARPLGEQCVQGIAGIIDLAVIEQLLDALDLGPLGLVQGVVGLHAARVSESRAQRMEGAGTPLVASSPGR